MGHVVTMAESAEHALERLDVDAFDVIVSDLGMGAGMNGWELADQVRQRCQPRDSSWPPVGAPRSTRPKQECAA